MLDSLVKHIHSYWLRLLNIQQCGELAFVLVVCNPEHKLPYKNVPVSLLYKVILSVCMYVRGLFAPTGRSFQDTDIWLILFDPKY